MTRADPRVDQSGFAARSSSRDELAAVQEVLIAEFSGAVPASTVRRHLAGAREQLLADGVRAGLAAAAESMTRMRLAALVPAHTVRS